MKKILYILTMMLVVVVTSCGDDFTYPPVSMGDVKGEGTASDPYNIAKAIRVAAANGETSNVFVFTAGYVVSGEIDTSYGNATFDLYDTPDGSGQKLIAYRIKDFDNQKFTDSKKVKPGDYIVVYAPLINFRGNTPETSTGGYLYSINGEVGSDIPDTPDTPDTPATPSDPAGQGTVDSPYNIAKAIEVAKANGEESSTFYYIEGYVVGGDGIDVSYGNATWDLYDNAQGSGSRFIAYRVKDEGNVKFTDANKVKRGDKVVIYAPIINYKGNTPETGSGGYLYSVNGQTGGSDTPVTPPDPVSGEGSETSPYSVADVIGGATGTDVWVKGYIVGWVDGQVLSSGANFNGNATVKTNLLIADAAGVTDVAQCVPVQLPTGDVRTALNLQDNPDNYKKEVTLKGNLERYFGTNGVKGVTAYKLDGQSGGGDNDTPDVPTGDVVYSGLAANMDGWTIDNTTLPEGLDYVWSWKEYNGSGYLNGSAYKDGAFAAEAYAYTTIDLSGVTTAKLTFDHAAKFQTTLRDKCAVVVRVDGESSWTTLTIPTWPEAGAWTFVNAGTIDLSAYAGKKVQIGLRYGSTTAGADTWEIKNFIVSK